MPKAVIGWDIGGAHVKAVWLDRLGVVQAVEQRPCALWRGLHLLEAALTEVIVLFAIDYDDFDHVITMTGELVDLFDNRVAGVVAIAEVVLKRFPKARFYAADDAGVRFVSDVRDQASAVASMNWHASALCIAQQIHDVLVLDIGSTTTDVTCCTHGRVLPGGWSDSTRLKQGSLRYTGVVRTPLMAWGPELEWQGFDYGLAAEYFATAADVYRLLGQLDSAHDMAETADGQDKSQYASMRRLARMVGHDVFDLPESAWLDLAATFSSKQLDVIAQASKNQLTRASIKPQTLVVLGAGAFLGHALAARLGLVCQPAQILIAASNANQQAMAVVCFPAYAVAKVSQSWV